MHTLTVGESLHARVLARAAAIMGGKAELRAWLRISMRDLENWLDGASQPPSYVFLKAVDLISAQNDAELAKAQRRAVAAERLSSPEGLRVLQSALNVAVKQTAAARGNIQLIANGGLRIVSQLGFEQPFLDFFANVTHETPASCGRAHELAQRVVVADVLNDPIFAGTPAAGVMREAGALAVQSTPLRDGSGDVIGMLSTHYEQPHEPTQGELEVIDRVSQVAARWLGGSA